MPIDSFKKLWISCHLLYPNPSQARDIFGLIVESDIDFTGKSSLQIFQGMQKLYRFYKTRTPVRSGSTNFEFSDISLTYWNQVLEKCNKEEAFALMSVLLDTVTFSQLAQIMRMSESKAKYLFNQGIKKIIHYPTQKFESKKEIKFKEYNSQDLTLHFVNEHLIEYVLNLSEPEIAEKLDSKLRNESRFVNFKSEILKFKAELEELPISHQFDEVMEIFGNATQLQNLKKLELKQQKRVGVGLAVLIIIISGLIIRPSFLKQPISQSTPKLVLEEIAITKEEQSFEKPSAAEIVKNLKSTKPVSATAAKTPTKTVSATLVAAKVPAVSVPIPIKKPEPVRALPTGVYRGTIIVSDFEQIAAILREKIIAVGGKKAGEVELGWIKNYTTSYFHFIYPSEKREELVNFIQQYGTLDYKFEPHPRVLPEGQSRFILEVHKGE